MDQIDPSTVLRFPNLNMQISNYGVQNAYRIGVMLEVADISSMFALSVAVLLTVDTTLSVQVLTRCIHIRYLSCILSSHEGT